MEQVTPAPLGQGATPLPSQPPVIATKPPYQPPRMIVYGTVAQLTKGSGGDYDDECTSGKQPGDDE